MTKAADLALGKIAAVKTALIEFTDGDDAIAVADAGVVTLLTTAVAKSEGGAVTHNIAQGLCKVWEQSVGAGTGFDDSFNAASLTDTGTGVEEINYTSNMANNDSALSMGHQYTTASGTGSFFDNTSNRTTALHRVNHYQNGSLADPVKYNSTIHGDLA